MEQRLGDDHFVLCPPACPQNHPTKKNENLSQNPSQSSTVSCGKQVLRQLLEMEASGESRQVIFKFFLLFASDEQMSA